MNMSPGRMPGFASQSLMMCLIISATEAAWNSTVLPSVTISPWARKIPVLKSDASLTSGEPEIAASVAACSSLIEIRRWWITSNVIGIDLARL